MKKLFAVLSAVVLSIAFAVSANAATVERTVSPSGHVVFSWIEECTVLEVEHEKDKDVVFVLVDGSEEVYSFYDIEAGYWKPGMTLKAVFDLCVTCGDEYPELNTVVEE